MKNITRLLALTALILLAVAAPRVARADDDTPQAVVAAYMNALKAADYPKAIEVLGLSLPPSMVEKMRETMASATKGTAPFRWQVTSWIFKEVREDGGLAVVTVQETSTREADEMVKSILSHFGDFGSALKWGELKVNETFVLVRLSGKWQFDSGHSGIPFSKLPLSGLADAAAKNQPPSSALQKQLAAFVNGIGIGQALQTLNTPVVPVIAAVAVPNFMRARAQGQVAACKSNLKNMGTALEMYGTDNAGHYPTRLSQLTPNYLVTIPTCPAAGSDTYAASFESAQNPDAYTVFCAGKHHEAVGYPANHPCYTSTGGLINP